MTTRPLLRTSRSDLSARKTYDLLDEPAGPEYDALLDGAVAQCATAVLTVGEDVRSDTARPVLDELSPQLRATTPAHRRAVHRYEYNRETAGALKRAARGLYAWQPPSLPQDLCLLRADGSPWLVSIARERLGYLELTPFEKLLLGRAAPGLAAVLAHQAARDAILAYFERRYESHVETVAGDLERYATSVVGEGREQLVDALAAWLESGEEARVSAALDVIGALQLRELRPDVEAVQRRHHEARGQTDVFQSNLVLRERWRSRRRRQLERVLDALRESPTRA